MRFWPAARLDRALREIVTRARSQSLRSPFHFDGVVIAAAGLDSDLSTMTF